MKSSIVRAFHLCLCGAFMSSGAYAADKEWFTLTIDDERVGYAYMESSLEKGSTRDVQYSLVAITQLRQTTRSESKIATQRDARNQMQMMDVVSEVGARRDSWGAQFDWPRNKMTRRIGSQSGRTTVSLPTQLYFPERRFSYLAALLSGKSTSMDYSYLEPSVALPTRVRATVIRDQPAVVADTVHIRVALIDNASASEKAAVDDLWLDRNGRLRQREQVFLGRVLRWKPCVTDCDASIATPFDPTAALLVRSPYHVPATAINGPIRYVITSKSGVAIPLPATGEQLAISNSNVTVVTICKDCGTEAAPTEADLIRYRQPNEWVQSDAKEIRSFAHRAVSINGTTSRRMLGLVKAVREHMTGAVDFLGYSSATEALQSRSGDCTEFAVLLAALARAEGIPTRVVFGLVYADRFSGKKNVFSPHAWVQAWDGSRWVSYDAALEKFDATHIAIAIGDGTPTDYAAAAKLLPQWKMEKLGLVKQK